MSRKIIDLQNNQDPYDLIRRLRDIINQQKQKIEQYRLICDALLAEKNAAVSQLSQQKKNIDYLQRKIELLQASKRQNQLLPKQLPYFSVGKKPSHNLLYSPSSQFRSELPKNDIVKSKISINSPDMRFMKKIESKNVEYIPTDIQFVSRQKKINHNSSSIVAPINDTISDLTYETAGEYLIEDFIMVGPDFNQFKKMRDENYQKDELTIKPMIFFNQNKEIKLKKAEYLQQIAKRAFPYGVSVRKKMVQNVEQLREQLQYSPGANMNEDYFIFTLKGQFEQDRSKTFLGNCNSVRSLYVVCMVLPDFILIRDEKHYQRRQQQIWMTQKVYVLLTYYPFMNIHLQILSQIQKIMKSNTIDKTFHQKEDLIGRHLYKNINEAHKNQQISNLIHYFMNKKPDFNQICFHQKHYFGMVPNFGFNCQYALARFACPLFFSTFSYQQMLLLITAVFYEKGLIFISKNSSMATLCALFLMNIISPFTYNQTLILNCDLEKMNGYVFQNPFSFISTFLKTKQNMNFILFEFIRSNNDMYRGKKQTAPLILIDIDSNTILYDPNLNIVFQETIFDPSKELREAYENVNSSHSKSFTFPKKMRKETLYKPKNDYEKNKEESKKTLKQYTQKIENNTTKIPTFRLNWEHEKILHLLTDYIRSFTIDKDCHQEILRCPKDDRIQYARAHLLSKHPEKGKFINCLLKSQIFADYLDSLDLKFGFL